MPRWSSDAELFAQARQRLTSAVVGDVMDRLGRLHQFLSPRIRPLDDASVLVGRAMPVLETDTVAAASERNPVLARPFGLMLEALDDLRQDEVYVCTGSSPHYALWGENMSTRARHLGAAGVVVDGYARDTIGIRRQRFPVFSYGPFAQDQAPRGKVVDFRVPIALGAVTVRPGDVVVGDVDGVCIVPREIEDDVFAAAFERAEGENRIHAALERGVSAVEAFGSYGFL